jgi:hypothetical protein
MLADVDLGGCVKDSEVTGNQDTEKVLATVMAILYDFLNEYSGRVVFFEGNSKSRNRLYRMAIGNNLVELSKTVYFFWIDWY